MIKVILVLRARPDSPAPALANRQPAAEARGDADRDPHGHAALAARRGAAAGGRQLVRLRRNQRPRAFSKSRRRPSRAEKKPERPRHLLALSARSPQALSELAGPLRRRSRTADPAASLADIVHTAAAGRTHFAHRLAVVAASLAEAARQAAEFRRRSARSGSAHGHAPRAIGRRGSPSSSPARAQYAGMGRALYETQPTFRAAIDRCAELLRPQLDRPLLSLLDREAGPLLDQTGYTQPVMFAVEYALATLWRSWGIEPAAVMGHSVGEFAAACVAGVFSLEDGLRLIAERARLMQSLAARRADGRRVRPRGAGGRGDRACRDRVAIAALNGPESIVISGDEAAVREVLGRFESEGVKSKTLATSHAFHSQRMDPILERLGRVAGTVACSTPSIDMIANLTGRLAERADLCRPGLLEPPRPLAGAIRREHAGAGRAGLRDLPGDRSQPDADRHGPAVPAGERLRVAALAAAGVRRLADDAGQPGRSCTSAGQRSIGRASTATTGRGRRWFPAIPFKRGVIGRGRPSNAAPQGSYALQRGGRVLHPLLGRRLPVASHEQIFEAQMAANRPAMLADHKIQGRVVMPGAAYLEMALAASAVAHGKPWTLCGASLVEPLTLDKTPKTVQTILTPEGPRAASFRIVSVTHADAEAEPTFTTLAVGTARSAGGSAPVAPGRGNRAPPLQRRAPRCPVARRGPAQVRARTWPGLLLEHPPLGPTATRAWPNCARRATRTRRTIIRFIPGCSTAASSCWGPCCPAPARASTPTCPWASSGSSSTIVPRGRRGAPRRSGNSRRRGVSDVQLLDASGRVLARNWKACGCGACRATGWPAGWPDRCPTGATNWPGRRSPWILRRRIGRRPRPGRWLIFDCQDGFGAALAKRLETKGHGATLVPAGGDRRVAAGGGPRVPVHAGAGRRGIVYLAGVDVDCRQEVPDFDAARPRWLGRRAGSGACLVGRIERGRTAAAVAGHPRRPGRWEIARCRCALAQSPVWGLGRVIAAEHPALACTRIDLDPARSPRRRRPTGRRDLPRAGRRPGGLPRRRAPRGPAAIAAATTRPTPCKFPAAGPTAWRSPPAASWTTWPCGRPCANRPAPARWKFRSARRG